MSVFYRGHWCTDMSVLYSILYLFVVIMACRFTSLIFTSKTSFSLIASLRNCSQAILKTSVHAEKEEFSKLSTLFVPGRHGPDIYQIVKPVINMDYIADNLGKIKLSCDHRGINLDLDYTLKLLREWSNVRRDFYTLVEKDQRYVSEITNLSTLNRTQDMDSIMEKRKELDLKLLAGKNKLHDIEDLVMPLLQKMPHILHPSTPLQFNVMDVCQEPPNLHANVKSHAEIAKSLGLIEFRNNSPISYFLSGKLAKLDFAVQMYFLDKMCSLGFTPLSCVDFCKSFIIEAIGYDPYSSDDCIQINNKSGSNEIGQKLHLVGGSSFETFCAYLTNMNISKSTLPLKYFSLGRRYNATHKNTKFLDLFSVVQSTNMHCLILSEISSDSEFDSLVQVILTCYSELNVPLRTVNIAANHLTLAESRRKQIELWSPAMKDYIPVAYVSQHDDFVSKRLKITYGEQHVVDGYCSIVEGVVLNIPVLIGCLIENFQTENCEFDIVHCLQKYVSFNE